MYAIASFSSAASERAVSMSAMRKIPLGISSAETLETANAVKSVVSICFFIVYLLLVISA